MSLSARSFCSGYGGLEMAVRAVVGDFDVLSVSDIKPAAQTLLAHRFPDVPNLGDMRVIDHAALERADVMIGSWPCQAHSSAGKRLGAADPRDLWPEYERAIEAARPAVFFGENVARIAGSGELARVARSLARLGYVGAWRCIRASDVGACHRRDRCFVVAVDPAANVSRLCRSYLVQSRDGAALPLGTIPGAGDGDRAGRTASGVHELGRTAGVVAARGGHGPVHPAAGQLTLLPTPTRRDVKGPGRRGARSDGYARSDAQLDLPAAINLLPSPRESDGRKGGPGMRGSSGDLMLPSAVMDLLPTPAVADARNTRNATAGRAPENDRHHSGWTLCDVAHADRWGRYAAAIARHEHTLGRSAPEPTMTSPRTGRPQLAPRFVEWMQMLPDGWIDDVPGLTRNQKLSLLGDGVVPAQAVAAFAELLPHLLDAEEAAA